MCDLNKNTANQVQEIINTAFGDAEKARLCINCRYSYFTPDYTTGYCKNEENNQSATLYPKMIDCYDFCGKWEKLNKK